MEDTKQEKTVVTKSKAQKGALFGRVKGLLGSHKGEEELPPPEDVKLYMLTEVHKLGIIHYLKSKDVEVAVLTDKVEDIIDITLQESHKARLIIIDYGRGTFQEVAHVEEVLSLIEAFKDIGPVVVLSNTRTFTVQVKRIFKDVDGVEVHGYGGAVDLYNVLKTKNEVYTIGGATEVLVENVMEFKATPTDIDTTRANWIAQHEDNFSVQEDSEKQNGLPAY